MTAVNGISIRTATLSDHHAVRDVRRRSSLSNDGDHEAVGFVAEGLVRTRFGPASRMHLDVEARPGRPAR
jgi:hypothetical protein